MKLIYVILIVIATTNTLKSQFYVELGGGYAFQTYKNVLNYDNNHVTKGKGFSETGNAFTGIFYKGLLGYKFKNNLSIELNCEYNPKNSDIITNTKGLIISYDKYSFYNGSFISIIPQLKYQKNFGKFTPSIGFGIGYNLLNYQLLTLSYSYSSVSHYDGNQNVLVYSYTKHSEELYKLKVERYYINFTVKFNYELNKKYSVFVEANVNYNYGVLHYVNAKIRTKTREEIFDVNNTPNYTLLEKESETDFPVNTIYINSFENMEKTMDLSKLIYTQIGLRYTFGKKEN